MHIPLPSILSTALAASTRWPVQESRPPLHYQPLEQMEELRKGEILQGLFDSDSLVLPLSPLELLTTLESQGIDTANPHFRVALGLLYLSRQGFADECHSLVTPLSWHDDTYVGYGAPNPSTEAEVIATYAHVLVHRFEGFHIGELNLSGYNNANFWGKATISRYAKAPGTLPYDNIRSDMETLLQIRGDALATLNSKLSPASIKAGREWFQSWIVDDFPNGGWEPRALNELCKMIETNTIQSTPDNALVEFATRANQIECDVLIRYCLEKAGYAVPDNDSVQPQRRYDQVLAQSEEGLRAASKGSSAHLDSFNKNGIIVIRNVIQTSDRASGLAKEKHKQHSAVAVACRLLNAPACASISGDFSSGASADSTDSPCSIAFVYYTDSTVHEPARQTVLGFDLGPNDVLVSSSGILKEAVTWTFACVPCQDDDPIAAYRDALFGKRGETPTTVVQWSKGTIF